MFPPSGFTAQHTAGALCGMKATLRFVLCVGKVPGLGQALRTLWGVPHSVKQRLFLVSCLLEDCEHEFRRPPSWRARVSRRPLLRGRRAGATEG